MIFSKTLYRLRKQLKKWPRGGTAAGWHGHFSIFIQMCIEVYRIFYIFLYVFFFFQWFLHKNLYKMPICSRSAKMAHVRAEKKIRLFQNSKNGFCEKIEVSTYKIWYKRYFNQKSRLNRCRNRKYHEQIHISIYIYI